MKLKYITFIFENCDNITIDGKYVGDFLVDDIHTSLSRIASNAINKIDTVDTFLIEIHKDANKERYQFDQTNYEDFKQTVFERFLRCTDITGIVLELYDDYNSDTPSEKYSYLLNWYYDENNKVAEYINKYENVYLSDLGHLYISISKNKRIKDFFDLESLNDEEYMNFHFSMCDVGDQDVKEYEIKHYGTKGI